MAQLYAACRPNMDLEVRHVQLTNQLQAQLDGIFEAQEQAFLAGIDNEIEFTGGWQPDEDELLVIPNLPEARILVEATNRNALAIQPLDVANFANEGVKALFTSVGARANKRLLVQNFSPQQFFSGGLALLHDGNVFRRLTEPAFFSWYETGRDNHKCWRGSLQELCDGSSNIGCYGSVSGSN